DENSKLSIEYEAVSDRDTQINLTNHAYFNLGKEDHVLNHSLQINADQYIEVDRGLIPTGTFVPVEGTVYDLSQARRLSETMKREDHALFVASKGFDVGFVLNANGYRQAAALYAEDSG